MCSSSWCTDRCKSSVIVNGIWALAITTTISAICIAFVMSPHRPSDPIASCLTPERINAQFCMELVKQKDAAK